MYVHVRRLIYQLSCMDVGQPDKPALFREPALLGICNTRVPVVPSELTALLRVVALFNQKQCEPPTIERPRYVDLKMRIIEYQANTGRPLTHCNEVLYDKARVLRPKFRN